MYYNKQGKKISLEKWSGLFEKAGYTIIKQESVGDYRISTVWLGLGNMLGEGNSLIFETMVFGDENNEQRRYSSLKEAEAGHKLMVKKYKQYGKSNK